MTVCIICVQIYSFFDNYTIFNIKNMLSRFFFLIMLLKSTIFAQNSNKNISPTIVFILNMRSLLFVFLGGGIGSVLRYMISMLGQHLKLNPLSWWGQTLFPWPTFVANLAGCLLIGLFYSLSDKLGWSPDTRLLLTTGLCGGFTTFSTFSNEGLSLLRSGNYILFAIYFALTLIFGLLCVWLGKAIG